MSASLLDIKASQELLEEAGAKNHVRVFLHRAGATELVSDSAVDPSEVVPTPANFALLDSVRMLHGLKPLWLREAARRYGFELVSVTPNLRTTVGIDYVASALGDSSGSRAAVAQYIALSNSTGTPLASDTATTTSGTGVYWGTNSTTDAAASSTRGELNYGGVARALATYAHTGSATNYTMTKQFTATGTVTAAQAAGLFNSATNQAGTLFVQNTFTATSLVTNDQLTIAWTVNI